MADGYGYRLLIIDNALQGIEYTTVTAFSTTPGMAWLADNNRIFYEFTEIRLVGSGHLAITPIGALATGAPNVSIICKIFEQITICDYILTVIRSHYRLLFCEDKGLACCILHLKLSYTQTRNLSPLLHSMSTTGPPPTLPQHCKSKVFPRMCMGNFVECKTFKSSPGMFTFAH